MQSKDLDEREEKEEEDEGKNNRGKDMRLEKK